MVWPFFFSRIVLLISSRSSNVKVGDYSFMMCSVNTDSSLMFMMLAYSNLYSFHFFISSLISSMAFFLYENFLISSLLASLSYGYSSESLFWFIRFCLRVMKKPIIKNLSFSLSSNAISASFSMLAWIDCDFYCWISNTICFFNWYACRIVSFFDGCTFLFNSIFWNSSITYLSDNYCSKWNIHNSYSLL